MMRNFLEFGSIYFWFYSNGDPGVEWNMSSVLKFVSKKATEMKILRLNYVTV